MPEDFTRIAAERSPNNMSTTPEVDRSGLIRPQGLPQFDAPPLQGARPPRCPPFVDITSSDQLLPYLEHVAQRPYNHGLNACWDLKPGERVMLRVDNWHSDLTIEACKKILEKY